MSRKYPLKGWVLSLVFVPSIVLILFLVFAAPTSAFENENIVQVTEEPETPSSDFTLYIPAVFKNYTPGTTVDLALEKTGGEITTHPGDTIIYELTYSNTGDQTATGVYISEILPISTSFNPGDSSAGWQQVGTSNNYTYEVGSLSPSLNGSVFFEVIVDDPLPLDVETIENVAVIQDDGSSGDDENPADNTANETTSVLNQPDLEIYKTADDSLVHPGDVIPYTLTYSNTGYRLASGVVISETLPEYTQFYVSGSSEGWTRVDSSDVYIYSVGSLNPGDSGSVFFAVEVSDTVPSSTTLIENMAGIYDDGTNGEDQDPSNNTSSTSISLESGVDLEIHKSTDQIAVVPGDHITYTLTYSNTGYSVASGVVLSDTLPDYTDFYVSGSSLGWYQVVSSKVYTYSVGTFNPGDLNSVYYAVTVSDTVPGGTASIENEAEIWGDGQSGDDIDLGNNTSSASVSFVIGPDLSISKSDGGLIAHPGETIIYELTYSNEGDVTSTGVYISENLPANTSFNAGESTVDWQQVGASDNYTYGIGTLSPSSNGGVNFAVTVDDPLPLEVGTIENETVIQDDGSAGGDANPGDNTANETTSVVNQPDLKINKTSNQSLVHPGDEITYTLTYSNTGYRLASGVVISETLPEYTQFSASGSSEGWARVDSSDVYTCSVDSLNPGDSGSVFFAVEVIDTIPSGTTLIENIAGIFDDGTNGEDQDSSNNTSSTSISIESGVDLEIHKSTDQITVGPGDHITYTLTYSNTGYSVASGVVLSDTLPDYTDFYVSGSSAGWNQVDSSNIYTFSVGALNPGERNSVHYAVTVSDTVPGGIASIENEAEIWDDGQSGSDLDLGNNSSSVSVSVESGPDLAISKSDGGVPYVSEGDVITYTLTYSNTGTQNAAGVVITETLPANTAFNPTGSLPGWTQVGSSDQYIYTISELGIDSNDIVTFAVTVDSPVPPETTSITNHVEINDDGSNGNDIQSGNNHDEIDTSVTLGPTEVGGTISTDTIWSPLGNPHIVITDLIVNSGINLTIEPGVLLLFNQNTGMTVNGTLIAIGTDTLPIEFTANSSEASTPEILNSQLFPQVQTATPGFWDGILFNSNSSDSYLEYVTVMYGGGGSGNIRSSGAEIKIVNSKIGHSSNYGLYGTSLSSITISNTEFISNANYSAFLNLTNGSLLGGNNRGTGNGYNGISISGSLGQVTTLSVSPGFPYIIPSNDLTVNSGITLTLQAGLVIKIAGGGQLTTNGTLISEGIPSQPVIFTSLKDDNYGGDTNNDGNFSDPAPGDWGTLTFSSTSANSNIKYTYIQFGGSPVIKIDQTSVSIANCSFYNNNGGIDLSTANQPANSIDANTFEDNRSYAIKTNIANYYSLMATNTFVNNIGNAIRIGTSTLTQDTKLFNGAIYWLGTWSVNNWVTLTVEPGTIIKFAEYNSQVDCDSGLNVYGTLSAIGTSTENIIFTTIRDDSYGGDTNADGNSTSPAPGNWMRIYLASGSSANLDYSVVRYGGGYCYNHADPMLKVEGSLEINNGQIHSSYTTAISCSGPLCQVSGSQVTDNGGTGFYLNANGQTLAPIIQNNVFNNNTGRAIDLKFDASNSYLTGDKTINNNTGSGNELDGIYFNGNITGTTALSASNMPFVILRMVIPANQNLTVEPGTIIKFAEYNSQVDCDSGLNVYGTLSAIGTSTENIIFTTIRDDSYGGDTNADGNSTSPAPGNWMRIYLASGSSANLDYSVVRYGGGYCYNHADPMLNNNGNLSILNSSINLSGSNGISNASSGNAAINFSIISANSNYGFYNSNTTQLINAENNWWGSDSGPAPYGSGNGINYRTCTDPETGTYICEYYVDADPWLGKGSQNGGSIPWIAYEAEPVNTANGNYIYQRTDISIPTRSIPLDFIRNYNSADPEDGQVGYGWTHSYNVTVSENTTDDSVTIRHGDGREERFTWNGSSYDPPAGTFSTLEKTGGEFQLTLKDQTVFDFDSLGRLDTIIDRNDNVTTLSYTGTLLNLVTAPDGRTIDFIYNPESRISQISDPLGRTIEYTYNITGELTTVTDPNGYDTDYVYDTNHRLLSITDANGHTFVDNTYNSEGRVVEQRDAEGNLTTFLYDILNHKTTVTDPLDRSTIYQYDDDLRLFSETDALSNIESYTYDDQNNRISITDKRGYLTSYDYDDVGNVLLITDTLGYTQTFSYDSQNNLLTETDAREYTTNYIYDSNGNLIQATDALTNTTIWTYDTHGLVLSATDARLYTTEYAYDTLGYQSSITDTMGNSTHYEYDIGGRLLSEIDALDHTTSYAYDNTNRLLTISQPMGKYTQYAYDPVGNRTVITDVMSAVTSFIYDEKDRLIEVVDPLSHSVYYGYDAVNNQTVITNSLGYTTTYEYDPLGRRISTEDALGYITDYEYDLVGNRISLTDANGHETYYEYDERNQLISVTDALTGTVSYSYDPVGNRISMTDANLHISTYEYDPLNRLARVTDPLDKISTYSYDPVGNRISGTKPDSSIITYSYDDLNRLANTSYPGGNIIYEYDPVGNRLVMTDTLGVTTYSYDPLNRLIGVFDANGALGYDYDLNDNRTETVYPGGDVVTYTYDIANRLIYIEDWDNHSTIYTYDEANRQTGIDYPNGIEATYVYDVADRLMSIHHTSPVSGTIAVFTYTLDAVGNRLSMDDLDGISNYNYDDLNRLIQVLYPNGEQVDYEYDPMGNRTVMTSTVSGVTTYEYDDGDRLLHFTDPSGTTSLTWDDNSNMTGKGGAVYTFDPLDRLTQVISGTTNVQFEYNGDGERLGKDINGIVTSYVQDIGAPLPVVVEETTSGQTSKYVYGNDLIELVDPLNEPSFYHQDGLGSTRALSNLSGQRTNAYSYDVFGGIRSQNGSSEQSYTFTGEQMEGELGLVFLRARYYDPEIGRFISRDTWPALAKDPQSISRFVYVKNNPIKLNDPSGLSAMDPVLLTLFDTDPKLGPYQFNDRLLLFLKFANPTYGILANQLILEMARHRPINTSLSPYIRGRQNLGAIGEISNLITFAQNGMNSLERARRGEIDSPERFFGEVFALSANTLNDIVTGPGRALGKLVYGQELVNETPIVAQLDQKITGPQVVENIETLLDVGPKRYVSCGWNSLWGGECQ